VTSRLVARVKSDCRTDRPEQIANTACVIATYNWEGGNTGGKALAKHRFPGICKLAAGGGWTSDVTHTSCCWCSVFDSRMNRLPNSAAPAGSLPCPSPCTGQITNSIASLRVLSNVQACAALRRFGQRRTAYTTVVP